MLWLWCRPAAVAPIRPLAWEAPHAAGVALKNNNNNKKMQLEGWGTCREARKGRKEEIKAC